MRTIFDIIIVATTAAIPLYGQPMPPPHATVSRVNISFGTTKMPLRLDVETFEASFLEKEKVRLKEDAKDPGVGGLVVAGLFSPLGVLPVVGYGSYKRWKKLYTFPDAQEDGIKIGEVLFSPTIIAGEPLRSIGPFRLRQVSVPLAIKPTWENITKFASDFSHVGIEMRVVAAGDEDSTIQVSDVLPNTQFVPANYGGKATFHIGVQANRKWGPLDPSVAAEGSFWWEWNPKVNIVASGAAGNEGFVVLSKKPDKSGWIGKLPVELLLLVPEGEESAELHVRVMLVYRDNRRIPLAEVKSNVLFY